MQRFSFMSFLMNRCVRNRRVERDRIQSSQVPLLLSCFLPSSSLSLSLSLYLTGPSKVYISGNNRFAVYVLIVLFGCRGGDCWFDHHFPLLYLCVLLQASLTISSARPSHKPSESPLPLETATATTTTSTSTGSRSIMRWIKG